MAAQVNIQFTNSVLDLSLLNAVYFKISIFTVIFKYYFLHYQTVIKHVMCE